MFTVAFLCRISANVASPIARWTPQAIVASSSPTAEIAFHADYTVFSEDCLSLGSSGRERGCPVHSPREFVDAGRSELDDEGDEDWSAACSICSEMNKYAGRYSFSMQGS
jgi:hypothetical protein